MAQITSLSLFPEIGLALKNESDERAKAIAELADKVKPLPANVYVTETGETALCTSSTEFVPLGLFATLSVQPGSCVACWPKIDINGEALVRVTRDGSETQLLNGRGPAVFENLEAGEHSFSVEWRAVRGSVEVHSAREMLIQEVIK